MSGLAVGMTDMTIGIPLILGIGIALFFPLVKLFVILGIKLEEYLNGK
jgi:hypothetical protein